MTNKVTINFVYTTKVGDEVFIEASGIVLPPSIRGEFLDYEVKDLQLVLDSTPEALNLCEENKFAIEDLAVEKIVEEYLDLRRN